METNHTTGRMRLCYNHWAVPEGKEAFQEYDFGWPDPALGARAEGSGHGGGDFLVIYNFVKDLEEGREPYFDIYRSTAMASVAILAWRSILNGISYDIPDFRKESDRLLYENDRISPYPDKNGVPVIPCSSLPYTPSKEDLHAAQEQWKNADYLVN